MKTFKHVLSVVALMGFATGAFAADGLSEAQEKVAKAPVARRCGS